MNNKESKDNEKNITPNEDDSAENISDKEASESTTVPIKPRKRKIAKNVQLPIVVSIVLVTFLATVVWSLFFNNSLVGDWCYIKEGEYTETFDNPTESADTPQEVTTQYKQRVCYQFEDNGDCIVTLGTMSVKGTYDLYTTEDSNILSASVSYMNTPVLFGSYGYRIEGNAFTGRKLIVTDRSTGEDIELTPGMGENPLTPYDDAQLDSKLNGKWREDDLGVEFEFFNDGRLVRTHDDGLTVEHYYTVFEDGVILVKYCGDEEQSFSYTYSFSGDNLVLNELTLKKVKD